MEKAEKEEQEALSQISFAAILEVSKAVATCVEDCTRVFSGVGGPRGAIAMRTMAYVEESWESFVR